MVAAAKAEPKPQHVMYVVELVQSEHNKEYLLWKEPVDNVMVCEKSSQNLATNVKGKDVFVNKNH